MTDLYNKLMKKCISFAKKGRGKTSPNPLVGCVVLDKDNNIISTGYHHKYGENHAERDALLKLKNGEEAGGTLIVNLEPCSHYGKTPPCADLIVERKLKTVVFGCKDNNPKVNGGGIKKLKDAGIEVIPNVCYKECRDLNEVFFTNMEEKRVFVALKTATTIDGKIATNTGNSKWITSDKARNYARRLRTYYDAILTSSSTVIADNPTMKHKTKVLLDRELKTDFKSTFFKSGKIYVVTDEKNNTDNINLPSNIDFLKVSCNDEKLDLKMVLNKLYDIGIRSVFVEAGGRLCGSFIKDDLVDKIYHFIAPKVLNDNSGKSCFDADNISEVSQSKIFTIKSIKRLGDDIMIEYKKS